MKHVAILIIKVYKKILSPFLPRSCRFYPSCSDYSAQAFERFGFIKGLRLSVSRILRCNPFSAGGLDPVPELSTSDLELRTEINHQPSTINCSHKEHVYGK